MEITLSYTLLQQETTYYLKNRTAEIEEASTETRKTFYTTSKFDISDHPSSQHVSPKDQIHPHFQNLSTFVDKNDRLNRNIDHLQTMIDDMIKEYEYMDQPLKFPQKQESSSITPTTDNSIFLNQQNN